MVQVSSWRGLSVCPSIYLRVYLSVWLSAWLTYLFDVSISSLDVAICCDRVLDVSVGFSPIHISDVLLASILRGGGMPREGGTVENSQRLPKARSIGALSG